ncbi:MAG: carboxymuconolactone decarboxylase family protein [Intrasporangium sp.]|uniref:carboxymuconolactone decarboxylase family protein n=1 Tax=Intrasporangium sp. TaxID=1925024 RepID=UPI002649E41C|nr:carboxymuconolactone decarboxylase family protein [Intrasporangium sp.]MDN5796877.1 carboxymuconolactone decarboxylase family protein [Intrasporangium sp.]
MPHYHDPDDMKRLREMRKAAPREYAAWMQLDGIVGIEDGAIPRKYRELIAIACAHVTQCVYCMDDHVGAAKAAGVSREELVEAALLAAALRAGAGGSHGTLALKLYGAAAGPEPAGQTG